MIRRCIQGSELQGGPQSVVAAVADSGQYAYPKYAAAGSPTNCIKCNPVILCGSSLPQRRRKAGSYQSSVMPAVASVAAGLEIESGACIRRFRSLIASDCPGTTEGPRERRMEGSSMK